MLTFAHPALLWGLLIAGVPVLIHLINMFRHRRVQWAAMEFLLISQRRNRTWVLLKQLLLLLLRMTAVTGAVLMLAQPRLPSHWGQLWDSRRVHHVVLLDDSYSMSDHDGASTAFERAKAAAERVGAEAARSTRSQSYTLIRFSQAANAKTGKPDLLDETVGGDFTKRLSDRLRDLPVSETTAGPLPALQAVEDWLGGNASEQRVIYLMTDFRAMHWDDPGELLPALKTLSGRRNALHFVQCVERYRPNVAITSLQEGKGIRAAGVPFFMELAVANHSDTPLDDVVVHIKVDGDPRPAVRIPRIPARQNVNDRVSIQFATPGEHVVIAQLDSDAVSVDNRRQCVVDVPTDLPVLLIDGDMEARDAAYLSSALRPGGAVATGLTPRIEEPRFLSQNSLQPFRAIYLLNVERLEDSAVQALEDYIAAGGGVGVFVGPRCSATFFNEKLFRNGAGFFPLPLTGQQALFVDRLEKSPDLEVTDHPIFRVFSGQRRGFMASVSVSRYFATTDPLPDSVDSSVEVIASLRGGAPLVVQRQFGKGRVVAFLTTAGPEWNNWARGNPSYVVAMLELQAYLTQPTVETQPALVGDDLQLSYDATAFSSQVRWIPPAEQGLEPTSSESALQDDGTFLASFPNTPVSGIYRADLARKDGGRGARQLAVNVDPPEGNLSLVDGPSLAARLDHIEYRYESANTFQYAEKEFAGSDLTDALLYALLAILLVEQFFAYWIGDHTPRKVGRGGAP